jgi:hypothetical protein
VSPCTASTITLVGVRAPSSISGKPAPKRAIFDVDTRDDKVYAQGLQDQYDKEAEEEEAQRLAETNKKPKLWCSSGSGANR